MRFEFSISDEEVLSTFQLIAAEKRGYDIFYPQLCFAQVTIKKQKEREEDFVLRSIPFLTFLEDLKLFLRNNATNDYAKDRISDMDQSYDLKLEKENGKLIFHLSATKQLTLSCPRKAGELDYIAGQFIGAYLEKCPQLTTLKHWDSFVKGFHFQKR